MEQVDKGNVTSEEDLSAALSRSSFETRRLFAFGCAEVLLAFCQKASVANEVPSLLNEVLEGCWPVTNVPSVQSRLESGFRASLEALLDRYSAGENLTAAICENAISAALYAHDSLSEPNLSSSVWAARQVFEASDAFLQYGAAIHQYVDSAPVAQLVGTALMGMLHDLEIHPETTRAHVSSIGRTLVAYFQAVY